MTASRNPFPHDLGEKEMYWNLQSTPSSCPKLNVQVPEGVGDDLPGEEAVEGVPRLGAEDVPRVLLVHVELLGLG